MRKIDISNNPPDNLDLDLDPDLDHPIGRPAGYPTGSRGSDVRLPMILLSACTDYQLGQVGGDSAAGEPHPGDSVSEPDSADSAGPEDSGPVCPVEADTVR